MLRNLPEATELGSGRPRSRPRPPADGFTSTGKELNEPRPHWQGQRFMTAKVMTANAAGRGPFLGISGEAAPERALDVEGSSGGGRKPSHLVWGSVLQQPGEERQLEGCLGSWGLRPALPPSLTAESTLDKQLQSIYLGPYGVGEQVCGNEEPGSN